jgi:hypothetical protein
LCVAEDEAYAAVSAESMAASVQNVTKELKSGSCATHHTQKTQTHTHTYRKTHTHTKTQHTHKHTHTNTTHTHTTHTLNGRDIPTGKRRMALILPARA